MGVFKFNKYKFLFVDLICLTSLEIDLIFIVQVLIAHSRIAYIMK